MVRSTAPQGQSFRRLTAYIWISDCRRHRAIRLASASCGGRPATASSCPPSEVFRLKTTRDGSVRMSAVGSRPAGRSTRSAPSQPQRSAAMTGTRRRQRRDAVARSPTRRRTRTARSLLRAGCWPAVRGFFRRHSTVQRHVARGRSQTGLPSRVGGDTLLTRWARGAPTILPTSRIGRERRNGRNHDPAASPEGTVWVGVGKAGSGSPACDRRPLAGVRHSCVPRSSVVTQLPRRFVGAPDFFGTYDRGAYRISGERVDHFRPGPTAYRVTAS